MLDGPRRRLAIYFGLRRPEAEAAGSRAPVQWANVVGVAVIAGLVLAMVWSLVTGHTADGVLVGVVFALGIVAQVALRHRAARRT